MTCIAYRDGIIAAERRVYLDTESGGTRYFDSCVKLYRVLDTIVGLAGESSAGLDFLKWYSNQRYGDDPPKIGNAHVIVLKRDGLYEVEGHGHLVKINEPFYAIGSGAKAALGAMHMGARPVEAVEIACKIDPYCGGKIDVMRLL